MHRQSDKDLVAESLIAHLQIVLANSEMDAATQVAAAEGLFIHLRSQASDAVLSESDGLVQKMQARWERAGRDIKRLRLV